MTERWDDDDLATEAVEHELTPEQEQDFDLVMTFLQDRLDPERAMAVRRRLEDDAAFRELAAPLLFAWSVPVRPVKPVSREELEQHWNEFTKRAGFIHQRRRARRRWWTIGAMCLLMLVAAGWLAREPLRTWYVERDYDAVPFRDAWIPLRGGVEARLAPGARLLLRRALHPAAGDVARLRGVAEFRVPMRQDDPRRAATPFSVETRGGVLTTLHADFAVRTVGDTTWVQVHRPTMPVRIGPFALPTHVLSSPSLDALSRPPAASHHILELERARLVIGQPPEKLP